MRIENEMLNRFNSIGQNTELAERNLSSELDFFFDNVMDTVVDYFSEREIVEI